MIRLSEAKRIVLVFCCALGLFAMLAGPFSRAMQRRSQEERLGYIPSPQILKALTADQSVSAGAYLVFKLMMYFGGIAGTGNPEQLAKIDYPSMLRLVRGANQLDPYNMDLYYFSQAILTWEPEYRSEVNALLERGMEHRSWDWYLPFFAGFNYAYFDQDYAKSAKFYQRAGELSGAELYKSLAGRYLQESGRTDLALVYLSTLEKGESNATVKKSYVTRLTAYRGVRTIEQARDAFRAKKGRLPVSLDELVQSGDLVQIPLDPYGGTFFLNPDGSVYSTSRFAIGYQQEKGQAQP